MKEWFRNIYREFWPEITVQWCVYGWAAYPHNWSLTRFRFENGKLSGCPWVVHPHGTLEEADKHLKELRAIETAETERRKLDAAMKPKPDESPIAFVPVGVNIRITTRSR